ncbi:MAG: hypothetical protein IID41_16760 [Planctomycetes bacterium]|nr:hypothetical protein [Planctomycetota bacterium]
MMRSVLLASVLLTAMLLPACQNSQKIVIERVIGPPGSGGFISTRLAYDSPLGKQLTKAAYDLGRLESHLGSLLGGVRVVLEDLEPMGVDGTVQGASNSAIEWMDILRACINGSDKDIIDRSDAAIIEGSKKLRKDCLDFFQHDNIYDRLPDARGLLMKISAYAFQVDGHLQSLSREAESWVESLEKKGETLNKTIAGINRKREKPTHDRTRLSESLRLSQLELSGILDNIRQQETAALTEQREQELSRWTNYQTALIAARTKEQRELAEAEQTLKRLRTQESETKQNTKHVRDALQSLKASMDVARAARDQIQKALRTTVARGGFGGFRATDIYEILPSDPMYERVLNATTFRVMSSAEARVTGDSGIMLVLEHAGQVRVYQVSSNPEQLVRNIGLIVSKSTAAVAKYATVGTAP